MKRVLDDLRARDVVFDDDGATWLRTTDFGDPRDRVLVKSDGATTYLCNDIAYHRATSAVTRTFSWYGRLDASNMTEPMPRSAAARTSSALAA